VTGDVLVLEPMRRRHVRPVVAIEEQVQARPWSPGLFLSELAQGDQRAYLVAKVGGHVVGFGGAMYVLPDAHITTIAVDPAHQRRSIGARLLVELCRTSIERGATALTLEVRVSNDAAIGLYRRFGFVPAGARKGYYPPSAGESGPAEDALVMWAHDIDRPEFVERLGQIAAALAAPRLEAQPT
jgi:[ribosomal protein S18]-alanine N-acetyltransferase